MLFGLIKDKKANGNGIQLRAQQCKLYGKLHVVRSNYDFGANLSRCPGLFGISISVTFA